MSARFNTASGRGRLIAASVGLATITVAMLGPVPSASADRPSRTFTTVLINNTADALTLDSQNLIVTPAWGKQPPSQIGPGETGWWSGVNPTPGGTIGTFVPYNRAAPKPTVVVIGQTDPVADGYCGPLGPPDPDCHWTFDVSDPANVKAYFTLGPRLDSQLSVTTRPRQPRVGQQFTIVATLDREPEPVVPAGVVSFTLDGSGVPVGCSRVPVYDDGGASCQAKFRSVGQHSVTATYDGTPRFLPAGVSAPVEVSPGSIERSDYDPARGGPNWQAGTPATPLDVGAVPGGVPEQIAVSHDDSQMLAIGADQIVYHLATDAPGLRPPRFAAVGGVDPGPMLAYRVAIDTDATTGQAQVVAIGLDHRIWHRIRYANGTWTSWGLTDPTFQASDVAIGIDAAGNAHVVAVGLDNTVWHRVRYANGGWSNWAYPPGYNGAQVLKASRVAVAVERTGAGAGGLTLVTVGTDGRVYRTTRKADGSWAPVVVLPVLPVGGVPAEVAVTVGPMYINGTLQQLGLLAIATQAGEIYRSLRLDGAWSPLTPAQLTGGLTNIATSNTAARPGLAITTYD